MEGLRGGAGLSQLLQNTRAALGAPSSTGLFLITKRRPPFLLISLKGADLEDGCSTADRKGPGTEAREGRARRWDRLPRRGLGGRRGRTLAPSDF